MNKNNLHTADNALNSLQNNVSEYPEGPKMTFTFVNDVINPSPPPKKNYIYHMIPVTYCPHLQLTA